MSALFRRLFRTVIFSRFSQVAIAASNFMNEFYNGWFTPEVRVSMLEESITLVRNYVSESKVRYSYVNGSPVLKAHLLQSFYWISATRFAELIHFWQDPKCRRNRTFWRKCLVFHSRKFSYFVFIYIFPLVLLFISLYIYIYIYIYIV